MQHENSQLVGRYTQIIQIISLTTNLITKHNIPIRIEITHPESQHRLKNESAPSRPTKVYVMSQKNMPKTVNTSYSHGYSVRNIRAALL